MNSDVLTWLQDWFKAQCDGAWEHDDGIRIETLDNPGWSVEISLRGTIYADSLRVAGKRHLSDENWIVYEVKDFTFLGFCGPANLSDLLEVFRHAVLECSPAPDE